MLWSDLERLNRLWDPWRDVDRLRGWLPVSRQAKEADFPPVNIWTSGDRAVITTEIPGMDPGSIDISVVDDTVTLRGSRKHEELKTGETYHRRERWEGQFTRTVRVPFPVDAEKVEARFARGVLTMELPRAEADKPRKIAVKSA